MGIVLGIAAFSGALALFGWLAGKGKDEGGEGAEKGFTHPAEPVSEKPPLPPVTPPSSPSDVKAAVEEAVKKAESEPEAEPAIVKDWKAAIKKAPKRAKPSAPPTSKPSGTSDEDWAKVIANRKEKIAALDALLPYIRNNTASDMMLQNAAEIMTSLPQEARVRYPEIEKATKKYFEGKSGKIPAVPSEPLAE